MGYERVRDMDESSPAYTEIQPAATKTMEGMPLYISVSISTFFLFSIQPSDIFFGGAVAAQGILLRDPVA